MRHRVIAKQPNSRSCFVCGLQNESGLQAAFFELDSLQVLAVVHPRDQLQGYPGRLHGGMATTLLDETIGRAVRLNHQDQVWGVTIELTTRFRQPIPLDGPLRAVGRIVRESRRHFEGTGEILLADGSAAVEARGRYLKVPLDEIAEFDFHQQLWQVVPQADDPQEVEF